MTTGYNSSESESGVQAISRKPKGQFSASHLSVGCVLPRVTHIIQSMTDQNIRVGVRFRTLTTSERERGEVECWALDEERSLVQQLSIPAAGAVSKAPQPFRFDNCFGPECDNKKVYSSMCKDIVASGIRGINGSILCYGQTSSGKTYTMKGSEDEPGILPLSLHQIFSMIREIKDREFLLRVSYLEVYNEQVRDLLEDDAEDLEIHEDKKRGFFVKDMREVIVTSVADALTLLAEGEERRHFGRTNANEMSSRSHVIFRVVIESEKRETNGEASTATITESAPVRRGLPKIPEPEVPKVRASADNEKVLVSTLNFVDLAGSERAAQTGGVGDRQKEGRSINKSLLFLGIVISKLSEGDRHVPFRDSKLTRILQSSLGGNARTAVVCCASPAVSFLEHSISTMRFGSRALRVRCQAVVNELSGDEALLHRHRSQIQRLRARLSTLDLLPMEDDPEEITHVSLQEKMHEQEVLKAKLEQKLNRLQNLILTAGDAQTAKDCTANLHRRAKSCGGFELRQLQLLCSQQRACDDLSTGGTAVDDEYFRAQRQLRKHESLEQQLLEATEHTQSLSETISSKDVQIASLESRLEAAESQCADFAARMPQLEHDSRLLNTLLSGAGVESLEESALQQLSQQLLTATNLVQRYLHWAEFKRTPLVASLNAPGVDTLPLQEQVAVSRLQRDMLTSQLNETKQTVEQQRIEVAHAVDKVTLIEAEREQVRIQFEQRLATMAAQIEEEKEQRTLSDAALQTTLAELNAARGLADSQADEMRKLKQNAQETSLKLLKHFHSKPTPAAVNENTDSLNTSLNTSLNSTSRSSSPRKSSGTTAPTAPTVVVSTTSRLHVPAAVSSAHTSPVKPAVAPAAPTPSGPRSFTQTTSYAKFASPAVSKSGASVVRAGSKTALNSTVPVSMKKEPLCRTMPAAALSAATPVVAALATLASEPDAAPSSGPNSLEALFQTVLGD